MRAAAAILACLLALPVSGEAAAGDPSWGKIAEKIRFFGEYSPADGRIPAGYGLSDPRGAAAGDHQADYANLWGYTDAEGVFRPTSATMVSEDWRLGPDGHWHIAQWVFELSAEGAVSSASRQDIVENLEHRVLDFRSRRVSSADPEARAKHEALLTRWLSFKP